MLPLFRICVFAALFAAAGTAIAQDICSDYLSRTNCVGGRRPVHRGADFGGQAGTEVISATHGTVVGKTFDKCAGHGIVIKTDIVARHEDVEGPVYVRYAHVEAYAELKVAQTVQPGDALGKIIPLRNTRCYGSREHVHYELRVMGNAERHISPHEFWADGAGKVTCLAAGASVPPGKAVAPLRCSR